MLLYKHMENNFCLWLFAEFIQTQKRHPTSLYKISNLTWGLLVKSSQRFSCQLNSSVTYFKWNISHLLLQLLGYNELYLVHTQLFYKPDFTFILFYLTLFQFHFNLYSILTLFFCQIGVYYKWLLSFDVYCLFL